jgi:2-oxoisovalerate dehydrogenase E1 component
MSTQSNPLKAHNLTKEQALDMLRQMWEIRMFEDRVYDLLGRNIIKGASHLYAGEEAVAVGAISVLRDDDLITSSHRGHGHCHARGAAIAKTKESKQEHYNKMMAELCGRETGYCLGRGGSMHIADVEKGNLGATGIVGGNIPVATGAALAQQMQATDRVVLCFFGDGASQTGNFHESLNLAGLWGLPVVFIVENNLYGMSVPLKNAAAKLDIAARACAYDMPGEVVDGMDVLAVREAVGRAVERARQGNGPSLIECQAYRWYGHSRSDPRAYRTKEEEETWKARDPIPNFAAWLVENEICTEEEIDALEEKVEDAIDKATEFALNSPLPPAEEVAKFVYTPFKWTEAEYARERALREKCRSGDNGAPSGMRKVLYREALQEAAREEMLRDERIFIMGEDVGLYGGAYGATRGLFDEFGAQRVRDTPISEATIGGAAVGAAMAGMRPIAEIMYVDFTPLAMDQIANQGAKNRYMFGGKTIVPMVIRTEGGAGRSIAAHHSQSLEALWIHFPGIYVAMPSTPYDAKGLLKAAIRDDNPVMFIEHKMLYGIEGYVPDEEYVIPFGVADVKRRGSDVTVITYSRMVHRALQAAETLAEEGIDVEVIDLRTLKPLDMDTIAASVKKTGRVVGITEAYKTGSFISELAMRIQEEVFDWLDAAVVRVAAADVPVPMSESLEDAAVYGNRGHYAQAGANDGRGHHHRVDQEGRRSHQAWRLALYRRIGQGGPGSGSHDAGVPAQNPGARRPNGASANSRSPGHSQS